MCRQQLPSNDVTLEEHHSPCMLKTTCNSY